MTTEPKIALKPLNRTLSGSDVELYPILTNGWPEWGHQLIHEYMFEQIIHSTALSWWNHFPL